MNQIGFEEKFLRFQFNDGKMNKEKYGDTLTPPAYKLDNIQVNTALMYGSNDNPKDVLWLRDEVASELRMVVFE